jgi:hypothetical protein
MREITRDPFNCCTIFARRDDDGDGVFEKGKIFAAVFPFFVVEIFVYKTRVMQ